MTLELLSRLSAIPLNKRSKIQTKMYQKISHFKLESGHVHDPYLGQKKTRILINDLILLPNNEIKLCIQSFYKKSKGDGARKLCYTIRQSYYGIGEKTIQQYLNEMETHRALNPRFDNQAPLKPVSASKVMERHQIDIVDLSAISVTIDQREYKYVLSVLDVFSRFLWLRPLQDKNAQTVAEQLYRIYVEFGPPNILQSDQGTEFKGQVKELSRLLGIKLIYSSSHHPQSQGKDERSHQTWKRKIHKDLMDTQQEGVCDWVTGMPAIQRIYNEGVHKSLGISPYECVFGIKSNSVQNINTDGTCTDEDLCMEVESDRHIENDDNRKTEFIQHHLDILQHLREKAKTRSDRSSKKMVGSVLSKNPPSKYVRGDRILLKHKGKDTRLVRGGSSINAPKVFQAEVLESNYNLHKYKVKFKDTDGKERTKWASVSNITSISHSDEKRKKDAAKKCRDKTGEIGRLSNTKTFHRHIIEKLQSMVLESIKTSRKGESRMQQLLQNAEQYQLELHSDNQGDGNCMFMALSHQLLTHGLHIEHHNVRRQLVDFIRNNPTIRTVDSVINLSDFIHGHNGNMNAYLQEMEQSGTWGDNLMLVAAANVFNARIVIVSSLQNADNIFIEPTNRDSSFDLYLGHVHEFHYVSLMRSEPNVQSNEELLCPLCGLTNNSNDKHDCPSEISGVANYMSSFPLADNEMSHFKVLIDNMITDISPKSDTLSIDEQQIVPLAKDHISLVFSTFMSSRGINFDEAVMDGEYFFNIPSVYFDMFLVFRERIKEICGTLCLIVLTRKVKQWMREASEILDEIQDMSVWFKDMFLMTQRARDSLVDWLMEDGDRGVEIIDELIDED